VPRRPEILLNLSVPDAAARAAALPAAGVGLLRAEFLALGVGRHPLAVLADRGEEAFVEVFATGLETVARAFHPRPVTYRTLDLKSNEYRGLEGGERFEREEANPAIGLRGAARYLARPEELMLELRAVTRVVDRGLDNVRVMIPFARTVDELREVRALCVGGGLGERGVPLWAMAETPSAALTAEAFAREVDGLSIGSNDLCQLVLAVDRDSPDLSARYPADDEAVLAACRMIVAGGHAAGVPVSICGDAPSREPGLVRALLEMGVDAISVVPSAYQATAAAIDDAARELARR
jgi:phosphoenolpyruvate synthase/pyruvate phosphate dikinase